MQEQKKLGGFDTSLGTGLGFGSANTTKSFHKAVKVKKKVRTERYICHICGKENCYLSHDVSVYEEDKTDL
jgi:hypothetical protein